MRTQKILIGAVLANIAVTVCLLTQERVARAEGEAPVLRGRALEIVDGQGRVRASISVFPADPTVKMPDGTKGYPETVLLRLINSKGRPTVKIESSDPGSGMLLAGENDPTNALITARGTHVSVSLTDKDGRRQTIKP